ncbi:MAG: hypothetical protein L0387_35915 [Acidobacteria bacterium]|nr:hypothetical protein [Acidobacteriota bacterium]MCI0717844.1 hypothetical protein [Acidobacteriota bacterium]
MAVTLKARSASEGNGDWPSLALRAFRPSGNENKILAVAHITVRTALAEGTLDEGRYESYKKLRRELKHLALKQDAWEQRAERQRWKKVSRMAKDRAAMKKGGR